MSTRADKQLATICMTDALMAANRAYYHDPSSINLAAQQACMSALKEMLRPYYMAYEEEETRGKE